MNIKRLKDFEESILHQVSARRINGAFDTLRQLFDEAISPWEMREQLGRMREAYRLLSQYALDGANDPDRERVYTELSNGIVDLLSRVKREVLAQEGNTLYFSTLRYENMRSEDSIASLIADFRKRASLLDMAELAGNETEEVRRMRADQEATERRLFNRVWVTYPISHDDEEVLKGFFADQVVDPTAKMLIVSALLLALLANYDERAMFLLLGIYHDAESTAPYDVALRMRALSAALIGISIHRKRQPGKRLRQLLDAVMEMPQWEEDVRMVFLQFIRTRDTEKLNRKMQDEVIPEMLKLRPDIYKKINENPETLADMASMEENPEWEDMLEKSGIADKMKELQEIQEDGGDVMMGTFGHLKTFPFFNDVANWFLPFRNYHSSFGDFQGVKALSGLLDAAPFLCNSDKYSVMLSLNRMPQTQRDMLSQQFNLQNENIQEARNATLSSAASEREHTVNKYVQDLYRFFKLFRRKGEFTDPFATSLNLATVPLLHNVFDNEIHLWVVAEFYFKRGYYEDALALFRRLADKGKGGVSLFQKMGYSLQRQGDMAEALKYYKQAELLAPEDVWTLRRIASCLRVLGRPEEALEYYQHIERLRPDDLNVTLHAGHCYMETGRYRDALREYFKVEFLDEKSGKALRPIAWCSFLEGDYERSRDYFSRIDRATLTSGDHLNMGHLEMATGNYRAAIERYRDTLEAIGNDRSKFASMMQADLHYLRKAGVADLMTGIVLDTLLAD